MEKNKTAHKGIQDKQNPRSYAFDLNVLTFSDVYHQGRVTGGHDVERNTDGPSQDEQGRFGDLQFLCDVVSILLHC